MTQIISTKGKTMIYLFFMVTKFCWWEFLFIKCNFLVAISNLGSGCAIETSNLEGDKYSGSYPAVPFDCRWAES
jgi:hypothetical protein